MKGLGFQQCGANAYVMRLVKAEAVSIVVIVHVDDIFAIGLNTGCDTFEDMNQFVAVAHRLPIFSRLQYWDIDDITAGFC